MSPKVLVGLAYFEIRICHSDCRRGISGAHSVMHITISLASIVTNELVAGWCITERVKRLAGNEIELGMKIPMIESRASNIPIDKGNYVCCHNGSTDKDLRRICRSQYGHPGSAIGYWPEKCLGHVYIVLEPVGSAHLTFDDDIVLYELCDRMLFRVPDEITDMTRSLEMAD